MQRTPPLPAPLPAPLQEDHRFPTDEIGQVVDADKLFVISTEITSKKIFYLRNEDFATLRRKVLAFKTPYGIRFRKIEEVHNCQDPSAADPNLFYEMFAMNAVAAFNEGLLLLVSLKRNS
jgi:hypothetical protein